MKINSGAGPMFEKSNWPTPTKIDKARQIFEKITRSSQWPFIQSKHLFVTGGSHVVATECTRMFFIEIIMKDSDWIFLPTKGPVTGHTKRLV